MNSTKELGNTLFSEGFHLLYSMVQSNTCMKKERRAPLLPSYDDYYIPPSHLPLPQEILFNLTFSISNRRQLDGSAQTSFPESVAVCGRVK